MPGSHFTPDELVQRLDCLIASAPIDVPPDLPVSSVSGQPAWHAFEHRVWSEGEALRGVLAQDSRLKRHPDVLLAVVRVLECPRLRRGRQAFALLLQNRAALPVVPRLVPLLSDPDISGHVVSALVKMHAPGLRQQLAPYAASPLTWVRRLAQAYLTRPEA